MIYGDFNQPISRTFHQRRDETVHALERNQRHNASAPHCLQRATSIAHAVAREPAAHGIRDPAGDTFDHGVFALRPISANQISATRNFREQARDIGGIIL